MFGLGGFLESSPLIRQSKAMTQECAHTERKMQDVRCKVIFVYFGSIGYS